ncbi:MAG: PTS sugar transporter subunit IIA [Candidatus Eisenbacteria bacterium]|uniref:PTS sugar transporter subunit IIA n=1 Tax=Eiseniibacteriota bacterium TaxID=2212470 RepID=A0A933SB61_UNCEI|nr:PTS sugar transporter subunit IIA [Candidatus Eisenbacteria bacterium]
MVTAERTPVAGIPLDVVELRLKRRESAWTQMVTTAHAIGAVAEPEVVLAALAHRERWGSTALGKGCALAGIRSFGVRRAHLVLGRSERGVDWGAGDDGLVHLVVLALAPHSLADSAYLDELARLAQALRLQKVRAKLADADPATALALLEGRPV